MKYITGAITVILILSLGFSDVFSGVTDISIVSDAISSSGSEAEGGGDTGHHDPFSGVFLTFFMIICTAVIGRFISRKLNQSPVLGELVLGMIVGVILYQLDRPLSIILRHQAEIDALIEEMVHQDHTLEEGIAIVKQNSEMDPKAMDKLESVMHDYHFTDYVVIANETLLLSSFGVLLLLFMVGLESSYEEMIEVGRSAFVVASLGVVFPFLLGYFSMSWLLPDGSDPNIAIFVGATLVATSIGITARVFKDMKALGTKEAKIVLGASVIDDIMGLIVLAIVSGIVTTGEIDPVEIGWIIAKAVVFIVAVLTFGKKLLRRNIRFFAKLDSSFVGLLYPFALLMLLAFLSDLIGLASIVGAFAAGLILKEEYFEGVNEERSGLTVEALLAPLEGIFAPVFFVIMGLQVDVNTFTNPDVLIIGLAMTVVAMIGKVAAAIFLKDADKLTVGFGLMPRGEVGLIFASIGKSLGVLDSETFSIIIIIVLLTTFITPPSLKWAIERKMKKA